MRRINIASLESWMDIDFYDTKSHIFSTYGDYSMFAADYDLAVNGEVIRDLEIPDGTTEINDWTFSRCNIMNVSFPNTLKTIGRTAFEDCDQIEELTIPGSVESVTGFDGMANLKTIILEEGVKKLNRGFDHCYAIKTVIIPASIEYCYLFSFILSDALKSIYVYAVTPPETDDVSWLFDHPLESMDADVYVPSESIDLYKTTEPWSLFQNILPIPDSAVDKVGAETQSPKQIYDLNGRKVSGEPEKGIYIIDGKKVVVR